MRRSYCTAKSIREHFLARNIPSRTAFVDRFALPSAGSEARPTGIVNLETLLAPTFAGNAVWQWLLAAGLVVILFIFLGLLRRLVRGRLHTWSSQTSHRFDDALFHVVDSTKAWFLLVLSFWVGSLVLVVPEPWHGRLQIGFIVVLLVQIGVWGVRLLVWGIDQRYSGDDVDPAVRTSLTLVRIAGRVIVWSAVALMALATAGVDITALVAGLGVGGIAIALALQSILTDLFASVSIVLDKPFVVGDFIIVGSEMGTVSLIGLKTTRVRSLGGEEISFANNDLLSSRIRNYKRMLERRVVFKIGVVYQTTEAQLIAVPKIVREIVEGLDRVRFDRCHFAEYGAFSLDFEIVYYVLDPDYNLHMDIRQQINLVIFRRFAADGIEFAYPTQTVLMPLPPSGSRPSVPGRSE